MSDSSPSPEQASVSEQNAQHKGSSKRLVLLIGVLALGLAAFAYDRMIARPAVEAAYTAIIDSNQEMNRNTTEILTNDAVQKLIGKTPAETFQDENGDTVEVYKWRAGMPIRTHDLFAVYKQSGDKLMFFRVAMGKYETGSEISKFDTKDPIVIQLTDEDIANMSTDDGESNAAGGDAARESNAAERALEQAEQDAEDKENAATDPPATDPPATDPPATDPPAADPPATETPAADPPASAGDDSTK